MKTTYNDILNAMKNKFFECSGERVDLYSDIGARFQAVASELYSLACYEDFVLKQAFPQTATGEYLDYHAALRSKKRKEATKSYGSLTFSLNEPLENDVEIPSGTICSVSDQPFIQVETDCSATIHAGELSANASAVSLGSGKKYNVPAGAVTVMVNPPISVAKVTNSNAFTGGVDAESDEKLRRRILTSYSVPQNGVTLDSISQSIENIDGVLDCVVYYEDGVYSVYIKTADNALTPKIYELASDAFALASLFNHTVNIDAATPKDIGLRVAIKAQYNDQVELESKIKRALYDCFDTVGIGEILNKDKLIMSVSKIEEIDELEINSSAFVGDIIPLQNNEFLSLGNVEVLIYE